MYAFQRDFISRIRNKSWLQRLRPLWKKTVSSAKYLARVAFGTALVVSAVVAWLAVVAITSSRDSDRCAAVSGAVAVAVADALLLLTAAY